MSERIARFYAEFDGRSDGFDATLNRVKTGMKEGGTQAQSFGANLKNAFVAATAAAASLTAAYYAGKRALDATVGETLRYAKQVREVKNLTGQTAEESSRFVQVLDDFGISMENINAAQRTFISNGQIMSLETLATLADQYAALGTQQEKNSFMLENFGRDYEGFLLMMEGGGERIRQAGAGVSDALLLDQETLDRQEELRVKFDDVNDSIYALKITIGEELMPAMIEFVDWVSSDMIPALSRMIEWVKKSIAGWAQLYQYILLVQSMAASGDLSNAGGVAGVIPVPGAQVPGWAQAPNSVTVGGATAVPRAGGGSFRGWAKVGDARGGINTPYTEYVYAPHGAVVYNQSQMAGRTAPPMSGGGFIPPVSDSMRLDSDTIRELAREIGIVIASRQA